MATFDMALTAGRACTMHDIGHDVWMRSLRWGVLAVAAALVGLTLLIGAADRAGGSSSGSSSSGPTVGTADQPVAFGTAPTLGGGAASNAPLVGMAATPDGRGYWLVGADGGVFSFGDAHFDGSMGGTHLAAPVVGMTATADGKGYWLVASDGGVFSFGDAHFDGSMGGQHLDAPVVGIASTSGTSAGQGYWLVAADGGVFSFGGAPFDGSLGYQGSVYPTVTSPVAALTADPAGGGYWLLPSTLIPVGSALPGAPPCEQQPGQDYALVRPSSLIFGCATSADSFFPIHWSSWTPTGATATATQNVNDCLPSCAGGTFSSYAMEVHLSAPEYVDGMYVFFDISATPTGAVGPPQSLSNESGLGWGWGA
jgi:hypothetical protein